MDAIDSFQHEPNFSLFNQRRAKAANFSVAANWRFLSLGFGQLP